MALDARPGAAGRPGGCPDSEHLAAYADGRLDKAGRAEVERHLAECAECRAVLAETMAFLASERAVDVSRGMGRVVPFRSRSLVKGVAAALAAAAALVLVVRLARPEWLPGLFGPRTDRPELAELVAAVAEEPTRPVEGRLTGGFKYAPPPSPTRGSGDREVPPDVRIAAAKIEKLALAHDTPENQAALGVAYLALGEWDRAVEALEKATRRRPADASFQNDLSVACLARGTRRGSDSDLERALAAADAAIAVDPTAAEPYFNRAVALDRLHRSDDARSAWLRYLARDSRSPWASDARRGLDRR